MRLHTAKVLAPALAAAVAAISSAHAAGGAVPGAPNRYESIKQTAGCTPPDCVIVCDAVPTGWVLEATNLHCQSIASGPQPFDYMEIELAAGPLRNPTQKYSFPVQASQTAHFFANEEIRTFFDAGEKPFAGINNVPNGSSAFLRCKLAGTLLKRS